MMEKVKKAIRLDVSLAPGVPERVVVYQTENESRSIEFILLNNGISYDYTGNGSIYIDKGDGDIAYKALTFENGKAEYILTDNDVAVPGVKLAEIRLSTNEIPISTILVASQFEIEIRRSLYSETAIESTSEGEAIMFAVIQAEDAAKEAGSYQIEAQKAVTEVEEKVGELNAAIKEASTQAGYAKDYADTAKAAAARAEAASNLKWQHLETVTFEADMQQYTSDVFSETDGVIGVFAKLYIPKATTSVNVTLRLLDTSQQEALRVAPANYVSTSEGMYGQLKVELDKGMWDGWWTNAVNSNSNMWVGKNGLRFVNAGKTADDLPYIYRFIIGAANGNVLPSGTIMEMWVLKNG